MDCCLLGRCERPRQQRQGDNTMRYQPERAVINWVEVWASPAPIALADCNKAPTKQARRQPRTSAVAPQGSKVQPHASAKAAAGQSCISWGISSFAAMTGMQTVNRPARRLPMAVMHVMQKMMADAWRRETSAPAATWSSRSQFSPLVGLDRDMMGYGSLEVSNSLENG